MELVIDANILFSALIKNSLTAELVFNDEIKLYSPEFIIEEFLKYEDEILEKTSRTRENFVMTMHMLKDIISVVPQEEYSALIVQGKEISPDPNDVLYFALALKLNCAIWSNDTRLKMQDKVKVYSSSEVMKMV